MVKLDFIDIIILFKIVVDSRLVSMFPCCVVLATQKHEKTHGTWELKCKFADVDTDPDRNL